jgi:hypothetical protein
MMVRRGEIRTIWRMSHYVRFEVFMVVTMKNGISWDVTLCGSCKNRGFELSASFIRVTRTGELRTMLAVTSNRCTCVSCQLQLALFLVHRFLSP